MSTVVIVILIVIIIALAAVGGALYLRHKRSEQLRTDFGSEYERELTAAPSRAAAEKDLQERQKRHRKLDLRPLEREEREGYQESWDHVQSEFVDSPGDAVREADRLVIAIMRKRGYPTDDFDQRADDVSVEHPEVVEHYRDAHQVAVAHERGDADTEDLRKAAISYRALVRALLEDKTEGADRNGSNSPENPRERRSEQQRPEQQRPAQQRSSTNDRSKT